MTDNFGEHNATTDSVAVAVTEPLKEGEHWQAVKLRRQKCFGAGLRFKLQSCSSAPCDLTHACPCPCGSIAPIGACGPGTLAVDTADEGWRRPTRGASVMPLIFWEKKMHAFKLSIACSGLALGLVAPAFADFTTSTSGLTTTYTETFEDSTSFSGGRQNSGNDDYLLLNGNPVTSSASFTFGALASLSLSFWYTAAGTDPVGAFNLVRAGTDIFPLVTFAAVTGVNPGPGTGVQYSATTSSNLLAGTYTLSFARVGTGDTFRVDDVVVSVTNVPEPTTVGMMLAGMGVVAVALRRRQRAATQS